MYSYYEQTWIQVKEDDLTALLYEYLLHVLCYRITRQVHIFVQPECEPLRNTKCAKKHKVGKILGEKGMSLCVSAPVCYCWCP